MAESGLLDFPRTDSSRLRLALRRLEGALAEQKAAVSAFRSEVGRLRESTLSLHRSVSSYQDGLTEVMGRVEDARIAARHLERSAQDLAAQAG
ncbi:hypothetical protein [Pseudoroseomonas sp. WGS1072]|uniref:hypothetical protein n=1 Tax=Roseomonas sp. WGS1072 TaxID=3366816 RepID=UPI003BF4535E